MRLSMRRMLLSQGYPAQKHSTEKVRQNSHLVSPPEFEIAGGTVKESHRTGPLSKLAKLIRNSECLPSRFEPAGVNGSVQPCNQGMHLPLRNGICCGVEVYSAKWPQRVGRRFVHNNRIAQGVLIDAFRVARMASDPL